MSFVFWEVEVGIRTENLMQLLTSATKNTLLDIFQVNSILPISGILSDYLCSERKKLNPVFFLLELYFISHDFPIVCMKITFKFFHHELEDLEALYAKVDEIFEIHDPRNFYFDILFDFLSQANFISLKNE